KLPLSDARLTTCPPPKKIFSPVAIGGETPGQRRKREQDNLEDINYVLKARSEWICRILKGEDSEAQREAWKTCASQWSNNSTIIKTLNRYINKLLIQSAK